MRRTPTERPPGTGADEDVRRWAAVQVLADLWPPALDVSDGAGRRPVHLLAAATGAPLCVLYRVVRAWPPGIRPGVGTCL
jgi:hypothetical protein